MPKPRIAFVVQRCGAEVVGGAERICLEYARRMRQVWEIEILTTCALDYRTWADHYPPGVDDTSGVAIRRFPVRAERESRRFNRVDRTLQRNPHTLDDEHLWMRLQGPDCPALTRHVGAVRDRFDAFVFWGYLYASTFDNLPRVSEKAWLVPFAHDEPLIYFRIYEEVFGLPRGLICMTPEEEDFLRRRFGFALPPAIVLGCGMDAPSAQDAASEGRGAHSAFREQFTLQHPFLLYSGRIDASKNVPQLLQDFCDMKTRWGGELELALMGDAQMLLPRRPDVRWLGVLNGTEKSAAYAAAQCLVMPSHYESLSLALLESWNAGRPVVVDAACAVTLGQTRRANGGLWYRNRAEFSACVRQLLENPGQAARLGAQGREFVRRTCDWKSLCDRLGDFVR